MKWIKGISFAVVYTFGFLFLAISATGGGHGNWILLFPIITWVFNFAALILLANLESERRAIFFVVTMLIYYVLTFSLLIAGAGDAETKTRLDALWLPAVWYFAGQCIIWVVFFQKRRKLNDGNFDDGK
jgi:hypothetical protein